MLWAITKLYYAIGRNKNLKSLFSQKMIILHLVTYIVYLVSLTLTYVYYSEWDTKSVKSENKVFISFAISNILLFFIQLVLIYIFYGLG